MKVSELIHKLSSFNMRADVKVISNGKQTDFDLCWSGNDDCEDEYDTKQTCSVVCFDITDSEIKQ